MDGEKVGAGASGLIARLLRFRMTERTAAQPMGRSDAFALAGLGLVLCATYAAAISRWGDATIHLSIGGRWFQSDGWRVFDDMTDFGANHFRDGVHPLFSLFSIGSTKLIHALLPVGPVGAIHLLNGVMFILWGGLLYSTIRLIGGRITDALLLTALAVLSAGSLFWFVVPETYVPGTVSIALCLFVVATAARRDWPLVMAVAATLSFTVTNWIVGLSAVAASRTVLRGAIIAVLSLCLVVAGWGVGKAIFPQPGGLFLLARTVQNESQYVNNADAGGIKDKLTGVLIGPMVAPDFERSVEQPTGALLSFQFMPFKSWAGGNILYILSSVLWLVMLACGLAGLWLQRRSQMAVTVALALGGQCGLHLVYGDETFLYALHFVPLYVVLMAVATTTRLRRIMLPLIAVQIVLAGANNIMRLDQAAHEPITGDDSRFERLTGA